MGYLLRPDDGKSKEEVELSLDFGVEKRFIMFLISFFRKRVASLKFKRVSEA